MKSWQDVSGYLLFQPMYDKALNEIIKDGDIVVEIGTWYGRSIIYLAQKCREKNINITLCGIDTFTGNEHGEINISEQDGKEYIPKAPFIFYTYSKNLRECECEDIITIASDSSKAAKIFQNNSIKFLFIDGNHSCEKVTEDLKAWYPKVMIGGVIAGDDYPFPSVSKAVKDFFKKRTIIKTVGQAWWVTKV